MRRETRETAGSRIFLKYTGKSMSKNEGINRGSSRVENEGGTWETGTSRMGFGEGGFQLKVSAIGKGCDGKESDAPIRSG